MNSEISFQPPTIYSLEELQKRLKKLKALGPISISGEDKKRNSAIGETIEVVLGLKNNSRPTPDWGEYEIKTSGISKSKISMFTLKWNFLDGYNLRKLGFEHGKEHFSKHLNLPCIRLDSAIPHLNKGKAILHFKINIDKETLTLKHANRNLGLINMEDLKFRFLNKFKNAVVIGVERIVNPDQIGFIIQDATVYKNASFSAFIDGLKNNMISIEFQIFILNPGTLQEKTKKKSSKIRISPSVIENLYSTKEQLV